MVIGIGNPDCGDDAAGILAVRKLAPVMNGCADVVESSGDTLDLVNRWRERERVILIDAIRVDGAPTGSVRLRDLRKDPPPAGSRTASTHTGGIIEAVRMAESLQCLPDRLLLVGIAGERFELGESPSDEVRAGAEEGARVVRALVF